MAAQELEDIFMVGVFGMFAVCVCENIGRCLLDAGRCADYCSSLNDVLDSGVGVVCVSPSVSVICQ